MKHREKWTVTVLNHRQGSNRTGIQSQVCPLPELIGYITLHCLSKLRPSWTPNQICVASMANSLSVLVLIWPWRLITLCLFSTNSLKDPFTHKRDQVEAIGHISHRHLSDHIIKSWLYYKKLHIFKLQKWGSDKAPKTGQCQDNELCPVIQRINCLSSSGLCKTVNWMQTRKRNKSLCDNSPSGTSTQKSHFSPQGSWFTHP